MDIKELEAKMMVMEKRLQTVEDINEIQILQRAYGYYLEHGMSQEVIDCFSDSPEVVFSVFEGTWLGKEGVRRYFGRGIGAAPSPELIHQVMQLSPIVHVDQDGKHAKGRWYSWGCLALPSGAGVNQLFMSGIYECEYIKEDGKWKIFKLAYSMEIDADPRIGWVKPERQTKIGAQPEMGEAPAGPKPDIPPHGMDSRYPYGYIFPFHYTHPVTGQETSEAKRNAALPYVPNMFSEEARTKKK